MTAADRADEGLWGCKSPSPSSVSPSGESFTFPLPDSDKRISFSGHLIPFRNPDSSFRYNHSDACPARVVALGFVLMPSTPDFSFHFN